ncbi:hypothetical protein BD324DRAFT_619281 [Kockovaella imperatae]|uniref:Uncharacterized protein n=1 Tax=Kockovaella imperatae TaxID=4999 RepID=A0A1Y1UMP8_9TREE|nr:hypothetical protein BD324DRAFT_619281 [Kockovaella imperatae]ORX39333.1 hypothetical protein BD324DRAFT_619281 [Kockovaella imperatae]
MAGMGVNIMADTGLLDIGILRSILLPNLAFSSSLILPSYLLQRFQVPISPSSFWTAATLGNTYWLAVAPGLRTQTLHTALRHIPRSRWLFLAGLTISSLRLIWSDLSEREYSSLTSKPASDQLFMHGAGHSNDSWTRYLQDWGGRILVHALITLPLLTPFRPISYPIFGCPVEDISSIRIAAAALWSLSQVIGILGSLPGHSLGLHDSVRHPESLANVLESTAYAIFLFSENLLNPFFLLSPIVTYLGARYRDSEADQELQDKLARDDPAEYLHLKDKWNDSNSFWPGLSSLKQRWTWLATGVGAAMAVLASSGVLRME